MGGGGGVYLSKTKPLDIQVVKEIYQASFQDVRE